MIVPQFWAEARLHRPRGPAERQITVRRFGWSDVSQDDAQTMADQRARAAMQRIAAGEKIRRREPKVPYNGAEGLPIREEVLARHGDVVITRNAYGAHCLNTPNILFADVDFEDSARVRAPLVVACMGLLVAGAMAAGVRLDLGRITLLLVLVALVGAYPVAVLAKTIFLTLRGGPERASRTRIETFTRHHPDWSLRLYRTPAGFRLLATHRVFDPTEPEVATCFAALGVDRVYAAMCRNQRCFRARLTPKPWRIGISAHLRPRPGVWPVRPEHFERRHAWIRAYEDAAAGFASCRFVATLGSQKVHPKAEAVQALHDYFSQASSGREIA